MLIEALAKLAYRAGAERISIEIPPTSGGDSSVMVVTSLGHTVQTGESDEHGRLLAALSAPLVVRGNVGELDSRLVKLIDELEEDYVAAADSLPETDLRKKRKELQDAASSKDEDDEAKDGSDAESEESAEDHAEALASGEADSL